MQPNFNTVETLLLNSIDLQCLTEETTAGTKTEDTVNVVRNMEEMTGEGMEMNDLETNEAMIKVDNTKVNMMIDNNTNKVDMMIDNNIHMEVHHLVHTEVVFQANTAGMDRVLMVAEQVKGDNKKATMTDNASKDMVVNKISKEATMTDSVNKDTGASKANKAHKEATMTDSINKVMVVSKANRDKEVTMTDNAWEISNKVEVICKDHLHNLNLLELMVIITSTLLVMVKRKHY